jgi:glycosyltransferase involved in cell wall biosynthesis
MKLLHVISSMNPRKGGPCQGVRNLAPRVCERGNNVEVVCLDDPNSNYLAHEAIPIHALGTGIGPWSYHPALPGWLKKNLRRFDGIILNGLWQFPGFCLSDLAGHSDIPPYFVFPHGMLDPWFQRAPERRFKAARNWFYWKFVEHNVIQRAEAVLFTCAEEMRLAQGTFQPYQPKRQINVGYGVSDPPERSQALQLAFEEKCPGIKHRPYLLFLGRIHPKKGLDILIQAYAAIYGSKLEASKRAPSLVIAGPGSETDFGKQMFELAASTCPSGSIFWPGMLTGDAKWGALYGAEALVLVSHQENFGIAVAEALSCGTPVLISNQINIWREIEEDNAGFVVDDTLAGSEHLLERWKTLSPVDYTKMKRAAQSSYENRFGIARAALNVVTLLEESVERLRVGSLC